MGEVHIEREREGGRKGRREKEGGRERGKEKEREKEGGTKREGEREGGRRKREIPMPASLQPECQLIFI